jgi:hypothetical protein
MRLPPCAPILKENGCRHFTGCLSLSKRIWGLIPLIKNTFENEQEVGNIISVLWDDLALTIHPVNDTVGPAASLAKSLSSAEFVKALSAGYGTDSASFSGGRALQKEDVGHEEIESTVNSGVIAALVSAIAEGYVNGLDEAESFLTDYGISSADARDIVLAVCKKSNSFMEVFPMAKGSLWDKIKADLKKSVSGKKDEDEDQVKESDTKESDNDDDEYEDAGPVIKALAEKFDELKTTIETMAKAQTVMLERLESSETMQKSLGACRA